MRAIAIDFETANEERASPCSVGLAWIEDGRVVRRAHRFIRPPAMRFAPGNVRVHGIRPADVEDAPDFVTVMAEFADELSTTLLLAHNAGFDMGVIAATYARYGRAAPPLAYLCTREIARRAWPGLPRYGLAALAERIGLSFRHHHAEDDADACARVALHAAGSVGTDRISVMARGLDLRARRISLGAAEPVRMRAPPLRPSATPLSFAVRGRSGTNYAVRGAFSGRGFRLSCDCAAGRFGGRCRHVTALLDGEVTDLVSDNLHDVEKLRVIVEALGADAVAPAERRRERAA